MGTRSLRDPHIDEGFQSCVGSTIEHHCYDKHREGWHGEKDDGEDKAEDSCGTDDLAETESVHARWNARGGDDTPKEDADKEQRHKDEAKIPPFTDCWQESTRRRVDPTSEKETSVQGTFLEKHAFRILGILSIAVSGETGDGAFDGMPDSTWAYDGGRS